MGKNNKPDTSPRVQQNSKDEFLIKEKFELTEKQKSAIELGINRNTKCLILDGCAGVSKTYLATFIALKLLNLKKVNGLTYIRTSIQSKDGEIGFIPGVAEEKTAWMNQPLFAKLEELLIKPDIEKLNKNNAIQTLPSSQLRGLNLGNVVVLDECQNALFSTIETVMTRMSEHSLLILCGDSSGSQNDLGSKTGFRKITEIFNDDESKQHGIFYIKFESNDIVRSKFVKFVVEKLKQNG